MRNVFLQIQGNRLKEKERTPWGAGDSRYCQISMDRAACGEMGFIEAQELEEAYICQRPKN